MYPEAYIEFLMHFHGDRDYFECHEVLEEYWKKVDKNNKNSEWVGFILLAVSAYHHRRKNFRGAERTLRKAINILNSSEKKLLDLGLDDKKLILDLNAKLCDITKGRSYSSFNLPIQDPDLILRCRNLCIKNGFTWFSNSDLSNEELIHRHSKRDRSAVINERIEALQKEK